MEIAQEKKKFISGFSEHLRPLFIIDTNIWMGKEHGPIFEFLREAFKEHGYIMTMYSVQFDEIDNKKKSSAYESGDSRRSRRALSRIEDFVSLNIMEIHELTYDARKGAYADPDFVKMFADKAKSGERCTFISEAGSLRTRVISQFEPTQRHLLRLLDAKDLLAECSSYLNASVRDSMADFAASLDRDTDPEW